MRKPIILLTALSCILAYFLFLPASAHPGINAINAVDPLFYAWNLMHNYQSVLHGFTNLLNANIFYPEGNTLAFSDTLYGQTIFAFPIIALTGNPLLAENIVVFLSFPLSALAMYFLTRHLTKHTAASLVAGLFYAFSMPRLAQIGHISMISSQWLPLFVLFFIRFLENRQSKLREGLLAFLFFFLALLSSIYFAVFCIVIGIIIAVFGISWEKSSDRFTLIRDRLKTIALMAVPCIILLGISLYPYFRLAVEHPEIKRTLQDASFFKAYPADYLSVLPQSFIAHAGLPTNINEHALYPTLTVFVLALAGVVLSLKKKTKYMPLFVVIVAVSFLLSLGPDQEFHTGNWSSGSIQLPYTWLYNTLPFIRIIRVPARFSIFVILGLSALAGMGLSQLEKRMKAPALLSGIAALLFLAEIWQTGTPFVHVAVPPAIPDVYAWLSGQPDSIIIAEVPFRPLFSGKSIEEQLYRTYDQNSEDGVYTLEAYRTYFSAFHRKRMLNGYSGFFPDAYNAAAHELQTFPSNDALYILHSRNVKYVILHAWQYAGSSGDTIRLAADARKDLKPIGVFGKDFVYEVLK